LVALGSVLKEIEMNGLLYNFTNTDYSLIDGAAKIYLFLTQKELDGTDELLNEFDSIALSSCAGK
jgi:hypothetical protein